MSEDVLVWIEKLLSDMGINYAYGVWSTYPVPFPYFVGEKDEDPPDTEDGLQQSTFILTGTGQSLLELERAKEKIRQLDNRRTILDNGSGVVLFYDGAYAVPIDEADMRRIQVNLQIKEWRVN
ncbi:MAG: hypothetical protein QM793_06770 [Muricomes sp.]